MIPRTLSSLWWRRYLRQNARPWDELENFPKLTPEEQRNDLGQRLLRQIKYFGTRADALPEWREAAHINDPAELLRIWPDLPILTKNNLRTRFPADEIEKRFQIRGRANCTGGSTGEPVHFFHDSEMMRSIPAAVTFSAIRMGWTPGMPMIILWGSERDVQKAHPLRNRWHGRFRNQLLVDGYNLSDETVERAYSGVRRGPVAVYGFTSMLEFVARRIVETGKRVPRGAVRVAWNGGETLFHEQSE